MLFDGHDIASYGLTWYKWSFISLSNACSSTNPEVCAHEEAPLKGRQESFGGTRVLPLSHVVGERQDHPVAIPVEVLEQIKDVGCLRYLQAYAYDNHSCGGIDYNVCMELKLSSLVAEARGTEMDTLRETTFPNAPQTIAENPPRTSPKCTESRQNNRRTCRIMH